jgi:DNA adenine methylase
MLMPPHRHYVEPFGGGAWLLIRKPPCGGCETYNDLDEGLTVFFRVIAQEETFWRFRDRVALLPCARTMWRDFRLSWSSQEDDVERAAQWWLVARQSFSGNWGNNWGSAVASASGGMASQCARWINAIAGLPQVHARLQRVQIEQQDGVRILNRYQGEGYLAYCDPPYVHSTRRGGRYRHEMTDAQHQELVKALLAYQGAVMLSGYRSALYEPLEAAGWRRVDIPVTCSAVGRTRGTKLLGSGAMRAEHRRTESVWLNPEAIARHTTPFEVLAARVIASKPQRTEEIEVN